MCVLFPVHFTQVRTRTSLKPMRTFEALSMIFLLLVSSLAFLAHAEPIPESTLPNVNLSKTPTTVPVTTNTITTSPPTPTTSSDKETDKLASSKTQENPSSDSSKRDKEPKQKSPQLLLYEVEKGIRNLSVQQIEYVLQLGDEVFSYSLADKLGYLKGGKDDDPHVKAIDANKKILVKKLEDRKEELKPAVKVPPPPPTTMAPSPQPETPSPLKQNRIIYEIVKKIRNLTVERIDGLLGSYDVETLPFALGYELHYDDDRDAAYFDYLQRQGGENLKSVLSKEKERKLGEQRQKVSQDTQPQPSRGDSEKVGPLNEGEGITKSHGDTQPDKKLEPSGGGGNKTKSPQKSQLVQTTWHPGEGEGTRKNVDGAGKEGKVDDRNDNQPSLSQDEQKDDHDEGDGDGGHPPFVDGDTSEDNRFDLSDSEDELNVNANQDEGNSKNQSQEGNDGDNEEKAEANLDKDKDGYAGQGDGDNKNGPADSGNAEGDKGEKSEPVEKQHQNEKEGIV